MELMTLGDWQHIEHFSQNEAWGDWRKMAKKIFFLLDAMRKDGGKSIIIHCGYEPGGHTSNSQHYKGLAVDLHIKNLPLTEQYLLAERYDWSGIGVYTDWNTPGLHVDLRNWEDSQDDQTALRGARWGRRNKLVNGVIQPEYVPLDTNFIKHVIEGGY